MRRAALPLWCNRIGDPERAAAEIDFTAEMGLLDGLQRLIAWRAAHKAEVDARREAAGVAA